MNALQMSNFKVSTTNPDFDKILSMATSLMFYKSSRFIFLEKKFLDLDVVVSQEMFKAISDGILYQNLDLYIDFQKNSPQDTLIISGVKFCEIKFGSINFASVLYNSTLVFSYKKKHLYQTSNNTLVEV